MPVPAERWTRKQALMAGLLVLLIVSVVQILVVVHSARAGQHQLERAQTAVREQRLVAAADRLTEAKEQLGRADAHLGSPNPVFLLGRALPYVRVQWRATTTLLRTAEAAASAGADVLAGAQQLQQADFVGDGRAEALRALEPLTDEVSIATRTLELGLHSVQRLRHDPLLSPLRSQALSAEAQLGQLVVRAQEARAGMLLVSELLGVDGPRRFLLLSQNPDEPRPGGGFIGTYGLLEAQRGEVELPLYAGIGRWIDANAAARIPHDQAATAYRLSNPPIAQGLEGVNTTPDWPTSARLAKTLWERGGGEALDGVVTFRTQLLFRIVGALGSVRVPEYGETVTEANVDARLEFHTHREAVRGQQDEQRKSFISKLAGEVFGRALSANREEQARVAAALFAGLREGELAVWSVAEAPAKALAAAGWDGAFPEVTGDFFADATFAYATKNGRDLQRTYTHSAQLEADGSGTSETEIVVRNTAPFDSYNTGTLTYVTPYGPQGGQLLPTSDSPVRPEPTLAGHPTAGWLRDAAPLSAWTLKVGWLAPSLLEEVEPGRWRYRLTFLPHPGHEGDVLNLSVTLPPGMRWAGAPPPLRWELDGQVRGSWDVVME